jgi:ribosomal protein L40E
VLASGIPLVPATCLAPSFQNTTQTKRMGGDGRMSEESDHNPKVCRQCRLAIPFEARICHHCNSYQDWRGHLNVSSTVLALVVALISVLTNAIPAINTAIGQHTSKVAVGQVNLSPTELAMVVSNLGDKAAFVRGVKISVYDHFKPEESPDDVFEGVLDNPRDAFVERGSRLLVYRFIPAGRSLSDVRIFLERLSLEHDQYPSQTATLIVTVVNSDSRESKIERPLPLRQVIDGLKAIKERCGEAVREEACDFRKIGIPLYERVSD